MNFKTSNVLVDEDFIPKVADAGLRNLLDQIGGSSVTSSSYKEVVSDNPFLDPEYIASVHFLLKLIKNLRVPKFFALNEMVADVLFLNRVKESGIYTIQSDVYLFGVFLIELASGREARADQSIIQLVIQSFSIPPLYI